MTTDTSASANVITLPNAEPSWMADIKEHASLINTYRSIARLKKVIALKMRACQNTPKIKAYDTLRSLPPAARARMALRAAIPKVRKEKPATPLASEVLMQEFAYLAKRQKGCRLKILELESRVLTAHPTTSREARQLLSFISSLVASGRKIEKSYLSDALEECVFAISTTANTPRFPPEPVFTPATGRP